MAISRHRAHIDADLDALAQQRREIRAAHLLDGDHVVSPEHLAVLLDIVRDELRFHTLVAMRLEGRLKEVGLHEIANALSLVISDDDRERAAHPGQHLLKVRNSTNDGWTEAWLSPSEISASIPPPVDQGEL